MPLHDLCWLVSCIVERLHLFWLMYLGILNFSINKVSSVRCWCRNLQETRILRIMNLQLISWYFRNCWFCECLPETGVVASESQKSHLPRPENQTVPTNYADMHSPSLVIILLLISGIKPRNEPERPKTKFKPIFRCAVSPASPSTLLLFDPLLSHCQRD